MSTSSSSSSNASSSTTATSQPSKTSLLIDRIPHIQVAMPPKGINSRHVDERCFVYCSQSIAGRHRGEEPWCRSICLRKIFLHEVRGIMNGLPVEAKYPLPPTGQKGAHYFQHKFRFLVPKSTSDSDSSSEQIPPLLSSDSSEADERDWTSVALSPTSKATQYWRPGYYVFMSSKLWPSSEELHNMHRTLARQTEVWQDNLDFLRNMRERREETVREIESIQFGIADRAVRTVSLNREVEGTILLPMPPTLPSITDCLSRVLSPTYKVLALTKESITSGRQKQLAERIWEKAQTKDPFVLARNVIQKAWETLSSDSGDDDDDDDTGRRGRPR